MVLHQVIMTGAGQDLLGSCIPQDDLVVIPGRGNQMAVRGDARNGPVVMHCAAPLETADQATSLINEPGPASASGWLPVADAVAVEPADPSL